MPQAIQLLSDFQGDNLSVNMFAGAKPSGALCDGADDSPVIQAAINAAQHFLKIPAGTYNIATPLLINGVSQLQLLGQGAVFQYTGTDDSFVLLELRGTEYVVVNGIKFVCTNPRKGTAVKIWRQDNSTGFPSRRNTLSNFSINGFSTGILSSVSGTGQSSENHVEHGDLNNCGTGYQQRDASADVNRLRNVIFTDTGATAGGATYLDIAAGSLVLDHVITGSTQPNTTQLRLENTRNIRLNACHFEMYTPGAGSSLIKVVGTTQVAGTGGYFASFTADGDDILDLSAMTGGSLIFHHAFLFRDGSGVSLTTLTNTGNGTLTFSDANGVTAESSGQVGTYTVLCTAAVAGGGTFQVKDPSGTIVQWTNPTTGSPQNTFPVGAFFQDQIRLTVHAGTVDFIVGDGFNVVVSSVKKPAKIVFGAGGFVQRNEGSWQNIALSGVTNPEFNEYQVIGGLPRAFNYNFANGAKFIVPGNNSAEMWLQLPPSYGADAATAIKFQSAGTYLQNSIYVQNSGIISNETTTPAAGVDKLTNGTRASGNYSLIRLSSMASGDNLSGRPAGLLSASSAGTDPHIDLGISAEVGDIFFRTNSVEQFRMKTTGELLIGSPPPAADGVYRVIISGGLKTTASVSFGGSINGVVLLSGGGSPNGSVTGSVGNYLYLDVWVGTLYAKTSGTSTNTGWTVVGGGTVTHTAGSLTSGQLIVGNGSADLATGNLSGDVTTSGSAVTTLKNTGPGAGTYTVGAKLTPGGVNGTITIDAQGRVTAITAAT